MRWSNLARSPYKAISVALSLFFTGFPSIFRNVSFLKFTPMIQLSSITASSFSVEYLITAILSLCFLGLCLGESVLKINRAGNFQRDLVLHLSLCHVAHAGNLSVPYTPDCGNTGTFVPANR